MFIQPQRHQSPLELSITSPLNDGTVNLKIAQSEKRNVLSIVPNKSPISRQTMGKSLFSK